MNITQTHPLHGRRVFVDEDESETYALGFGSTAYPTPVVKHHAVVVDSDGILVYVCTSQWVQLYIFGSAAANMLIIPTHVQSS